MHLHSLRLHSPLELHLPPATAGEALEPSLLEELERHTTSTVVCKRVPALPTGRVIRIITIVIPLAQFCGVSSTQTRQAQSPTLVAQHLVRLIQRRHLLFGATDVWMSFLSLGAAE